MKTYHYIIQGRVQGVAFRYSAVRAAARNNICGTVRNLHNGDVEVYAQGNQEHIAEFEKFLYRGPALANVMNVKREEFDKEMIYDGFEVY